MLPSDWAIFALVTVVIALFLFANQKAKININENTPAPVSLDAITPPGVTAEQVQTIQSAISKHVPEFDHSTATPRVTTAAELKSAAATVLARANTTDNRFTIIGAPEGTKFVDGKGVAMYRLGFSVYDAVDNAGCRLESVVYNNPDVKELSVAHFRHAHTAYSDTIAPAEEKIETLEQPSSFEAPWDYARRFAM